MERESSSISQQVHKHFSSIVQINEE
jgi:hypothetical protein